MKGELIRLALGFGRSKERWRCCESNSAEGEEIGHLSLARSKGGKMLIHAESATVNNATKVPTIPFELTPDGIETLVAINHIGHFVFTTSLLPLLQRTAELPNFDVRVITVSSSNHTSPTLVDFTSEAAFQLTQGKTAL